MKKRTTRSVEKTWVNTLRLRASMSRNVHATIANQSAIRYAIPTARRNWIPRAADSITYRSPLGRVVALPWSLSVPNPLEAPYRQDEYAGAPGCLFRRSWNPEFGPLPACAQRFGTAAAHPRPSMDQSQHVGELIVTDANDD